MGNVGVKLGRPSDYNTDTADRICEQLIEGRSLRSICAQDDMPARSAVFRWLANNPTFADQYARARSEQAETIFDEMLDIADDSRNDWMESLDEEGGIAYKLNGENIQRARLRIDARKWVAGKLKPKKYGEKVELEHTGEMNVKHSVADLTDEELAALVRKGS